MFQRWNRILAVTAVRDAEKTFMFGTTRYNWGEKKSGFLAPKRSQMKHLDFVLLLVRD